MNISINNRQVRTLVAASALGLAFAAGSIHGRAADATPQRPAPVSAVSEHPTIARQYVYYVVESRQAALDAERAEVMTALERVLTGTVSPERIVHIIDDSPAGRMTAMEQMLVATGH